MQTLSLISIEDVQSLVSSKLFIFANFVFYLVHFLSFISIEDGQSLVSSYLFLGANVVFDLQWRRGDSSILVH